MVNHGKKYQTAVKQLDRKMAYHPQEAIEPYDESLKIFREIGLPRGEAQARYNLAEALAATESAQLDVEVTWR